MAYRQVTLAQRLYDAGHHTVAARCRAPPGADRPVDGHTRDPASAPRTSRACPSCGHEPTTREEATTQRADLAVTRLSTDPNQPGQLFPRQHCRHCQPHHPVVDIACAVCGDGPILASKLATAATDAGTPPKPVQHWLGADGWQLTPELLCPDHRTESAS